MKATETNSMNRLRWVVFLETPSARRHSRSLSLVNDLASYRIRFQDAHDPDHIYDFSQNSGKKRVGEIRHQWCPFRSNEIEHTR